MKNCPRCKELMFSNSRIFIDSIIPFLPMTCKNCHCIPGKSREYISFLPDLISGFFSELLFFLLIIISLFKFGNIWIGLGVFIITRLIKAYYISKGDLIDPDIEV